MQPDTKIILNAHLMCRGVDVEGSPTEDIEKFYDTELKAYSWLNVKHSRGHKFTWKWYSPNGSLSHEYSYVPTHEETFVSAFLEIRGHYPARTLGRWRVEVHADDALLVEEQFVIKKEHITLRSLERATTKDLVSFVLLSWVVVAGALVAVSAFNVATQILNTLIDSIIKVTVLIGGTAWALNRYFIGRTDMPQLRVEPSVFVLSANRFAKKASRKVEKSLLVCQLDIFNTGKTLIEPFERFMELHAVLPGPEYKSIYRWPTQGTTYIPYRIEPGSWASDEYVIPLDKGVQAIRVHLELELKGPNTWSWDKVFDLYAGQSAATSSRRRKIG